jgi:hypothetical protein
MSITNYQHGLPCLALPCLAYLTNTEQRAKRTRQVKTSVRDTQDTRSPALLCSRQAATPPRRSPTYTAVARPLPRGEPLRERCDAPRRVSASRKASPPSGERARSLKYTLDQSPFPGNRNVGIGFELPGDPTLQHYRHRMAGRCKSFWAGTGTKRSATLRWARSRSPSKGQVLLHLILRWLAVSELLALLRREAWRTDGRVCCRRAGGRLMSAGASALFATRRSPQCTGGPAVVSAVPVGQLPARLRRSPTYSTL